MFLRDEPDENTGNDLVKPQTSQNALVEKCRIWQKIENDTLRVTVGKNASVTRIGVKHNKN